MLLRCCAFLAVLGLVGPPAVHAAPPAPTAVPAKTAIQAQFGADALVRLNTLTGTPRTLRRLSVPTVGATPAERTLDFVGRHRALLLGDTDASALVVTDVDTRGTDSGRQVVRLAQQVVGLRVEGREMVVVLDADGRVTRVQNDMQALGLDRLETHASRDIGEARAAKAVGDRYAIAGTSPATKVILPSPAGPARIAYRVPTMVLPLTGHFNVWVDAETGMVLRAMPASTHQALRQLPLKKVTR
ncbi:MAG: Zn-dependent metalloprotease [Myxococcota bacterium]|jgi:Zn-dependent metalloprotease